METTERKSKEEILFNHNFDHYFDDEGDEVYKFTPNGINLAMQEYATQQTEPLIKALKGMMGIYEVLLASYGISNKDQFEYQNAIKALKEVEK